MSDKEKRDDLYKQLKKQMKNEIRKLAHDLTNESEPSDELTDDQVIEEAITLAIKGGWDETLNDNLSGFCTCRDTKEYVWFDGGKGNYGAHVYPEEVLYELIFNHSFAKALWGDALIAPMPNGTCLYETGNDGINYKFHQQEWQYRGTQMFLAEDRIDYLRQYLKENRYE